MQTSRLKNDFYNQEALQLAKSLLGKVIVRKTPTGELKGEIVETEAYIGESDKACHARFGRTKRTEIMYGKSGRAYIYLCYGLFNLFNIVAHKENDPAAVLIRRIKPLSGLEPKLKSYGPGNLTKYLKIDRELNGYDLICGDELFLVEGFKVKPSEIRKSARIGIDYAQEYKHKKWRFFIDCKRKSNC